ncbi:MAG: acylphosphatase [Nitrospirae bacterium]|nr:acylphosphatase [Nitrospirota bacterium]
MTSRAHLFIEGRVQGVCYRAFTREQAEDLGLNGWVRNLHDGRVEAVFEGQQAGIEQAIISCRTGPSGSRVTHVDVTWESAAGEKGFEIRY